MNAIRLSAVLTAALLTGAVSATALAAEVEPAVLPVTDASITFKKGISLENAPGAGGIQGSIAFAVSPAQQGDLPPTPEDGAQLVVRVPTLGLRRQERTAPSWARLTRLKPARSRRPLRWTIPALPTRTVTLPWTLT